MFTRSTFVYDSFKLILNQLKLFNNVADLIGSGMIDITTWLKSEISSINSTPLMSFSYFIAKSIDAFFNFGVIRLCNDSLDKIRNLQQLQLTYHTSNWVEL